MSRIHDAGMHGGEHWIAFYCPGCEETHSIPVAPVYEGKRPWGWNGSLDLPTIVPSIEVNKGQANPTAPHCHSHVVDGMIQFLVDCSHHLRGQTVEIPDWANRVY